MHLQFEANNLCQKSGRWAIFVAISEYLNFKTIKVSYDEVPLFNFNLTNFRLLGQNPSKKFVFLEELRTRQFAF